MAKGAKASHAAKPAPLRVDAGKYPGLQKNPALERALRIRQALEAGKPREEAVAAAEQAMGRRAPAMGHARPKPVGRPASGPRPGGKAAAPKRKPAVAPPRAPRKV
jgi:hypothetical protein